MGEDRIDIRHTGREGKKGYAGCTADRVCRVYVCLDWDQRPFDTTIVIKNGPIGTKHTTLKLLLV